jgi:hypothetical protein
MVMHLIVAGAASPLFRRPRWRCHRFHRISRYSSLVISFFPFSRLCAYSFLSTSSQRFFHDDDQVDFRTVRTPSPLTFAECIKEEVYPAKPRGVWTLKPRPACHERRRRANHRRALVRASLRLADSSTVCIPVCEQVLFLSSILFLSLTTKWSVMHILDYLSQIVPCHLFYFSITTCLFRSIS